MRTKKHTTLKVILLGFIFLSMCLSLADSRYFLFEDSSKWLLENSVISQNCHFGKNDYPYSATLNGNGRRVVTLNDTFWCGSQSGCYAFFYAKYGLSNSTDCGGYADLPQDFINQLYRQGDLRVDVIDSSDNHKRVTVARFKMKHQNSLEPIAMTFYVPPGEYTIQITQEASAHYGENSNVIDINAFYVEEVGYRQPYHNCTVYDPMSDPRPLYDKNDIPDETISLDENDMFVITVNGVKKCQNAPFIWSFRKTIPTSYHLINGHWIDSGIENGYDENRGVFPNTTGIHKTEFRNPLWKTVSHGECHQDIEFRIRFEDLKRLISSNSNDVDLFAIETEYSHIVQGTLKLVEVYGSRHPKGTFLIRTPKTVSFRVERYKSPIHSQLNMGFKTSKIINDQGRVVIRVEPQYNASKISIQGGRFADIDTRTTIRGNTKKVLPTKPRNVQEIVIENDAFYLSYQNAENTVFEYTSENFANTHEGVFSYTFKACLVDSNQCDENILYTYPYISEFKSNSKEMNWFNKIRTTDERCDFTDPERVSPPQREIIGREDICILITSSSLRSTHDFNFQQLTITKENDDPKPFTNLDEDGLYHIKNKRDFTLPVEVIESNSNYIVLLLKGDKFKQDASDSEIEVTMNVVPKGTSMTSRTLKGDRYRVQIVSGGNQENNDGNRPLWIVAIIFAIFTAMFSMLQLFR